MTLISKIFCGLLLMFLLFVVLYNLPVFNTRGVERSGSITGIFTDYEIDDSCGDVLWCYTEIQVNDTWYYFGSPCNYVETLPKNETYTFIYIPHRNMDCSGDYFWDTQISKIYDKDNDLLWKL